MSGVICFGLLPTLVIADVVGSVSVYVTAYLLDIDIGPLRGSDCASVRAMCPVVVSLFALLRLHVSFVHDIGVVCFYVWMTFSCPCSCWWPCSIFFLLGCVFCPCGFCWPCD